MSSCARHQKATRMHFRCVPHRCEAAAFRAHHSQENVWPNNATVADGAGHSTAPRCCNTLAHHHAKLIHAAQHSLAADRRQSGLMRARPWEVGQRGQEVWNSSAQRDTHLFWRPVARLSNWSASLPAQESNGPDQHRSSAKSLRQNMSHTGSRLTRPPGAGVRERTAMMRTPPRRRQHASAASSSGVSRTEFETCRWELECRSCCFPRRLPAWSASLQDP